MIDNLYLKDRINEDLHSKIIPGFDCPYNNSRNQSMGKESRIEMSREELEADLERFKAKHFLD